MLFQVSPFLPGGPRGKQRSAQGPGEKHFIMLYCSSKLGCSEIDTPQSLGSWWGRVAGLEATAVCSSPKPLQPVLALHLIGLLSSPLGRGLAADEPSPHQRLPRAESDPLHLDWFWILFCFVLFTLR